LTEKTEDITVSNPQEITEFTYNKTRHGYDRPDGKLKDHVGFLRV
jgi:hypothetical protein